MYPSYATLRKLRSMILKMTTSSHLSIVIIIFLITSLTAQTPPPPFSFPEDWNYRLINSPDPEFPLSTNGDYGSTYRCYAGTPYDDFHMSFCFFNTTPNAYTLALGTGYYPGNDAGHWIWAANTNRPVREGAGVFLLPDGNLVLYDFDGRVAWQSNTSSMAAGSTGWVTIKTRVNELYGDMVLVNINDDIPYWQSFDHPSYSLFPNQVLQTNVDKLVSYRSTLGGRYTMKMSTNKSLSLYYKGRNSSKPLLYYTLFKTTNALEKVTFTAFQDTAPSLVQSFVDGTQARFEFANFGQTYISMFLRIERDGNLKIYGYRQDTEDAYWVEAFNVFTKAGKADMKQESECQLPEKCGNFGICNQDECVTCPTSNGLVPWTSKCKSPKLIGCSGGTNATYYKIEGVEHFTSKYTKGERNVTLSSCENKCSVDCTCLGYFYHQETSQCWAVSDLKTLTNSTNPMHFGYVKMTA